MAPHFKFKWIECEPEDRPSKEKGDAIMAIAMNSQRLGKDAALLFENGRFASSVALSVLALEEVGKLLILLKTETADLVVGHGAKRDEVAKEFQSDLKTQAVFDLFCGRFVPGKQTTPATPTEIEQHIEKMEMLSPRAQFIRSVGQWKNDPKNKALYVDVRGDSWEVTSSPNDVDEALARDWLVLSNEAMIAATPVLNWIVGE